MGIMADAGAAVPGGERFSGREPVVVLLDDETLSEDVARLRSVVGTSVAAGGRSDLVIDIAAVHRLSSAAVAALLWAKRHSAARGGRVVVRGPNYGSLHVLRRAGLSEVFEIEPAPASVRWLLPLRSLSAAGSRGPWRSPGPVGTGRPA